MKRKKFFISVIILSFFLIQILGFIFEIDIYSKYRYIDLNSGEIMTKVYFFSLKIKENIYMTEFSKEVSRLGISVPNNRIWKLTHSKSYSLMLFPTLSDGLGGYIEIYLSMLMSELDENNIPDNTRITIIQEILSSIKNENATDVRSSLRDILKKLEGKEYNTPQKLGA